MFELLYQPLFPWSEHILFLARLLSGTIMIYFGWPKITDLRSNANDFVKMGFQPGILWGTIIAILEFFGGIGMILGLLTAPIAFAYAFQMIMGTLWKSTRANKPFSDYSYDLLLFVMMLIILSFGPGNYSIFF